MINIENLNKDAPYIMFKNLYEEALDLKQNNIEAVCISSYSRELQAVNARFVNLKYITEKEFIFFSNYNSPKSKEFISHDQISAVFYWDKINVQIRLKAKIKKLSYKYNSEYFKSRNKNKNALAISSNQSSKIKSFEDVKTNFLNSLENDDLTSCPKYWGGYSFTPYYFEFWKGHQNRLNKRVAYEEHKESWKKFYLQP